MKYAHLHLDDRWRDVCFFFLVFFIWTVLPPEPQNPGINFNTVVVPLTVLFIVIIIIILLFRTKRGKEIRRCNKGKEGNRVQISPELEKIQCSSNWSTKVAKMTAVILNVYYIIGKTNQMWPRNRLMSARNNIAENIMLHFITPITCSRAQWLITVSRRGKTSTQNKVGTGKNT